MPFGAAQPPEAAQPPAAGVKVMVESDPDPGAPTAAQPPAAPEDSADSVAPTMQIWTELSGPNDELELFGPDDE